MAKYRINGNVLQAIADAIRSKTGDTATMTPLEMPDKITAMEIGDARFAARVTNDAPPDGILNLNEFEKIGRGAFMHYAPSLGFDVTGSNVTEIGADGFRNASCKYADFPSVLILGEHAFADSMVNQVNMTPSTIGQYAFYRCEYLPEVDLSNVSTLNNFTFWGCKLLNNVAIPEGVTSIGQECFRGCTSLTSITLPETLTTIKSGAFEECSALEAITLPDGLRTIEGNAFYYCTKLKNVNIPSGATLGASCFQSCKALEEVTITNPTVPQNGFADCSALASVAFTNDVTDAYFGYGAFARCTSLESITLPPLKSNGLYSGSIFQGCTALREVRFTNTPTGYVSNSTFAQCANLADIYVPWSEGTVAGAPWGATAATIHYNSAA